MIICVKCYCTTTSVFQCTYLYIALHTNTLGYHCIYIVVPLALSEELIVTGGVEYWCIGIGMKVLVCRYWYLGISI